MSGSGWSRRTRKEWGGGAFIRTASLSRALECAGGISSVWSERGSYEPAVVGSSPTCHTTPL